MIENFDNTNIQSFEYETTINSDGNIIGTCELGNATIQMLNDSNEYSSLKGQWIKTIHGSFYIHSVEPIQEKVNIKLSCYDVKYKLDTQYDSSLYIWPMTLKDWRNQIGNNCGVTFDNTDFPNSQLILSEEPYVGDNPSNRNVISLIAQAGCSWVDTDKEDIFYFNWFDDYTHSINDWLELTTEKEMSFPINVVVLGRGDVEDNTKWPEILPENPTEFRIDNNYILDPQQEGNDIRLDTIVPIYNRVNGFSYLVFSVRTQDIENKLSVKLGQKVEYKDIWDNTLSAYIMRKKLTYLGGDVTDSNNYEINLSAEEINETSTEYSYATSIDNRVSQVERTTDKQNGIISDVIKLTQEQNNKISKVTQTVEELNSKISDIADITISAEDTDAQVELDNINQSEPIRIVVRPIGEDISYLYPRDNLFPSDDLYLKNRIIRFENKTTGEIFDYELPDDLLYYGGNYYDEFILDYDSQSCVVNKNVAYNPDGTKYLLRRTEIINYEFPTGDKAINLTDGDYVVSLPGYSNAYLFVRLMAQNIYTTQFATRAELNSEISQTARDITLIVSETYATKKTTNSLSTRIKQTAKTIDLTATDNKTSAGITIKLKNEDGTQIDSKTANITMSGLVKFTDLSGKGTTEINGANITTGTLDASKVNVTNLNADNIKSGTISTSILGSDVITTKNFSAQKINADNITTGTLSCDRLKGGTINGQTISGGTISGSKITSTSGNIGGFIIDGSSGLAGSYGTIRPNGNLLLYPNYGSARYVLSDKITFNAQGGVVIASNSNANVSVYNTNLDLKACAGAIAYLGCMGNTDGTDERSAVECGDRTLYLRSDGVIYANGAAIGGSSSKNTKTNIVELSQEKKDELYKLIKDIPLCEYDYKPQYGKENNYGFLIEDIEETKLNDLLHITKVNEDIKTYCSEDLTRLNLIIIKELMNKVESLENRIKELESDK